MWYRTGFNKEVPKSAITVNGNEYRIAIGKLGMKSRYLKRGKKVKIKVNIKRSFFQFSTDYSLKKNTKI